MEKYTTQYNTINVKKNKSNPDFVASYDTRDRKWGGLILSIHEHRMGQQKLHA